MRATVSDQDDRAVGFNIEKYRAFLKPDYIETHLKYSSSLLQASVVGPFWKILGYK